MGIVPAVFSMGVCYNFHKGAALRDSTGNLVNQQQQGGKQMKEMTRIMVKQWLTGVLVILLLFCTTAMVISGRESEAGNTAAQQNSTFIRADGYTNDPDISEASYLANPGIQPNYFQLHLAGPGLTAWDYSTGAGINVAVFDEGFDPDDPELAGKVMGCYNAMTDEEGADKVEPDDSDRVAHGTSCAKILGAIGNNRYQSAGVAYDVNLYLIRVGGNDPTWQASLQRGIDYAIRNNCRVISASVSDPVYNADVENAVSQAYSRSDNSILFVASGGNTNKEEYRYPSSYKDAFGVSAVNYSSGNYIISSSTWNDHLDIAAPGGTTSAATPYAAGVAALVFSADPSLTAAECAQILRETATDAGSPGYDKRYGHGIINPLAAVQRAKLKQTSVSRSITGVEASYTKKLSEKSFRLTPQTEGSGVFTYHSGNPAVAAVDKNGLVTMKKTGTADITISIALSGIYQPASVTVRVHVTEDKKDKKDSDKQVSEKAALKKVTGVSLKTGKRSLTVRWKSRVGADGYQIWLARNRKFTKGKKTVLIKKNKKIKKVFRKLTKNKKYFVKIRTFIRKDGVRTYGKFSKIKTVKVR